MDSDRRRESFGPQVFRTMERTRPKRQWNMAAKSLAQEGHHQAAAHSVGGDELPRELAVEAVDNLRHGHRDLVRLRLSEPHQEMVDDGHPRCFASGRKLRAERLAVGESAKTVVPSAVSPRFGRPSERLSSTS